MKLLEAILQNVINLKFKCESKQTKKYIVHKIRLTVYVE